eukprot:scaffold164875_cov31-Tisochrysis_lutea.AAC.2
MGGASERSRQAWIVVVSIASQTRPQYWKAQRQSWARRHTFMKFDEADAAPCRQCAATLDRRYWWKPNASASWWCAQKRPLQAIRAAAMRHDSASWFLIVDDDTWVNMILLEGVLKQLEAEEVLPPYFGHAAFNGARLLPVVIDEPVRSTSQVMGGAGIVLHSSGITSLLRRPKSGPLASQTGSKPSQLDECIEKQTSGSWCWWNSDWALAECLEKVGVRPVGHPRFAQVGACGEMSITCHHVDDIQQKALWQKALDGLMPCNQTNMSNWRKSVCKTPFHGVGGRSHA